MRNLILLFAIFFSGLVSAQTFDFTCPPTIEGTARVEFGGVILDIGLGTGGPIEISEAADRIGITATGGTTADHWELITGDGTGINDFYFATIAGTGDGGFSFVLGPNQESDPSTRTPDLRYDEDYTLTLFEGNTDVALSSLVFSFEIASLSATASYTALASGYEITVSLEDRWSTEFNTIDINVLAFVNGVSSAEHDAAKLDVTDFPYTFPVDPLETTTYQIEVSGGDTNEAIFATAEVSVPSSGKGGPSAGKGLRTGAEQGSMTIVTTSIAFDISATGLTYDNWDDAVAILSSTSSETATATETNFLGLSSSDTIKVWANIGNGGIPFAEYDQIELDGVVYDFNPIVEGEMNEVVLGEPLVPLYEHGDFTDEDGDLWIWDETAQTYTCSINSATILTVTDEGISSNIGDEWLFEEFDNEDDPLLAALKEATFNTDCFSLIARFNYYAGVRFTGGDAFGADASFKTFSEGFATHTSPHPDPISTVPTTFTVVDLDNNVVAGGIVQTDFPQGLPLVYTLEITEIVDTGYNYIPDIDDYTVAPHGIIGRSADHIITEEDIDPSYGVGDGGVLTILPTDGGGIGASVTGLGRGLLVSSGESDHSINWLEGLGTRFYYTKDGVNIVDTNSPEYSITSFQFIVSPFIDDSGDYVLYFQIDGFDAKAVAEFTIVDE